LQGPPVIHYKVGADELPVLVVIEIYFHLSKSTADCGLVIFSAILILAEPLYFDQMSPINRHNFDIRLVLTKA